MPLLPCWSVVIAAFETECLPTQERAMGRSSWTNAGDKGRQTLAPAEAWKSERADLEFRLRCSGEKVETVNRLSGTQRHDHVPNTSPASIGCAGLELCKKFTNEVTGDFSAVSQDAAKAVVWRTTTVEQHTHSKNI